MNTRLIDPREIDSMTVQQADDLFARLAEAEIRIRKVLTAAEKRIADIKAAAEQSVSQDKETLQMLRDKLSQYILQHRDRFQKPRARKTSWGKYGLRTAAKVEILDEEKLISIADFQELALYTINRKIDKKAVEQAISEGYDLENSAIITSGEVASYDIDKSLLAK